MIEITFTHIDEEGEETELSLPARYDVCPRCEGHGTHLNPSIGEHAYTPEEFNETFHDEEDRQQYFRRGGIYDVPCGTCLGQRVVPTLAEELCTTTEQKRVLAIYQEKQADDARYEALCRAERRAGC